MTSGIVLSYWQIVGHLPERQRQLFGHASLNWCSLPFLVLPHFQPDVLSAHRRGSVFCREWAGHLPAKRLMIFGLRRRSWAVGLWEDHLELRTFLLALVGSVERMMIQRSECGARAARFEGAQWIHLKSRWDSVSVAGFVVGCQATGNSHSGLSTGVLRRNAESCWTLDHRAMDGCSCGE